VSAGVLLTAMTTSPRNAIPSMASSARPTSLEIMNGYSSTAPSCANSSTAEGVLRMNVSTRQS
jgi:hypothetical protein